MKLRTILLGSFLSIILGAANAYLGLFAGMTISASIPAAVLSMGILSLFKNSSIKENNLVQTSASAGESLAAGVIFTIPALILIGSEPDSIFKGWEKFNYFKILMYSLIGGIMGIFFTIPLRKALIENAKLSFPEGQATAKVLEVGNNAKKSNSKEAKANLKLMILASIYSSIFKLIQSGFHMISEVFTSSFLAFKSVFGFGVSLSPALLSVGFIIGKRISIMVFSGGAFAWIIILPILTAGTNSVNIDLMEYAYEVWNKKIRYIGVGTMLVGGIWSLISVFKFISIGFKNDSTKSKEAKDIPSKWVWAGMILIFVILVPIYNQDIQSLPLSIGLCFLIILMGFLFSSVAAYMAGVVGSSNNPISGVTIATIMFSSLLILFLKGQAENGPLLAILIGSVVCCAAAIGGDNMQDLKTGHIINATPWKQQIMQIIGVISASLVMGFIVLLLHNAYGIGDGLKAPQANLMKFVSVGIFSNNLPWDMIIIGAIVAICIIITNIVFKIEIHILAVAVGIYLPIELSIPILIGGLIADRIKTREKGILIASGIITGEALMGIIIAIPIFISGNKSWWPHIKSLEISSLIVFIAFIGWFYYQLKSKKA
ncbi:MAG: oligopeptide transporter, OPT family [Candidatus Marinimicrobia bacterium]|nr:oligopeptide transporter, OPT family [Candidatus Neomarinimicrobiota bacterium]|tara:strand:- start:266 stop:2068 length:1803 start_codon:yes stop_codon:yes gene_type:complete